jgi:hypothetical protein
MKASIFWVLPLFMFSACSSAPVPPVQMQAYAALSHERVFESEFHLVWKALEEAMRKVKVIDRDPSEVDTGELKRLTRRTLETDWAYTQSRDKYQEYKVNGVPRKVYLQAKVKYKIEDKKILGGVQVVVNTQEQIEKLREDGSSAGWSKADTPDPARANEVLDKIQQALLALPN